MTTETPKPLKKRSQFGFRRRPRAGMPFDYEKHRADVQRWLKFMADAKKGEAE